ncbi:hypothetical protein TSAR_007116 [Trichomalopsis sarcophagae]|uniref:Uncharacterized protein n=1 Tax=Trichomalopsis sarcophagae TaxID=543379 RepID=A0A232ERN8_9HYME|nr:hypothetical protein TSAR_007116 [Trichomalopsis sarcophagae]
MSKRKFTQFPYTDNFEELTNYMKKKIKRMIKNEHNSKNAQLDYAVQGLTEQNETEENVSIKDVEQINKDHTIDWHKADDESTPHLEILEMNESSDWQWENNIEVSIQEDNHCNNNVILDILKNFSSKSDTKLEDQLFKSVNAHVDKSFGELFLISLKYCLSGKLPFTEIVNLMKLINIICGKKILPDTRYEMNKLCNDFDSITFHSVCSTCSAYNGEYKDFRGTITCELCGTIVDVSNPSNSCFFAIIDPSNAIRKHLKAHEDYYSYIMNERVHEKNQLNDIYDGKLYREFISTLSASDKNKYVTAVMNTDGAPEGTYFEGSMRYPYVTPLPLERTKENTIEFAKEALNIGQPVFGVKSASPLLLLTSFDIIRGFTPDYMHCVLAGVVTQLTDCILCDLPNSDIENIDQFLLNIKVPNQLCRLTRSLKDRRNWKAREWENWLLYYSVPVFNAIMKKKKEIRTIQLIKQN